MEHLFENPVQPVVSLDSINTTAAIWTGLKQYSWMKPTASSVPIEPFGNSASLNVVANVASQDKSKQSKKRKKADTPSRKKEKPTSISNDNDVLTTHISEQTPKKTKTNTPKQKTPKSASSKTKKTIDTPPADTTLSPKTVQDTQVVEQSFGAALQIPDPVSQDTPTKTRKTKNSEKAESEMKEPKQPTIYECPEEGCGKVFDRKGTLNRHMASHSDERNFKCDVCDKAFKLKGELVRHYKAHTSKQFECTHPGCGKKFSFECNLERHVFTIHMGVKNFECTECKKAFAQPTDLERHMLVHTGERPFACKWCDAKFKQLGHLQNHEKRKHDATKVSEQEFLNKALTEEKISDASKKEDSESDSEDESDMSSSEDEKKAIPSAPTRRSSRTAAKNALYNFDFSDSEGDDMEESSENESDAK